jgi:hypothetical protein
MPCSRFTGWMCSCAVLTGGSVGVLTRALCVCVCVWQVCEWDSILLWVGNNIRFCHLWGKLMTELLLMLHTVFGEFVDPCCSTWWTEGSLWVVIAQPEWQECQADGGGYILWSLMNGRNDCTRTRNVGWPLPHIASFRDLGVTLTSQNYMN